MDTTGTHKIRLLEKQEIGDIYSLPKLSEQEIKILFFLNKEERNILSNFHTLSSKILFILQLGFFRFKKRFYPLEELEKDKESIKYIIERYFQEISIDIENNSLKIAKSTRLSHQSEILNLFDYNKCTGDALILVKEEAQKLANIHASPSYIISKLLRFLERQRIVTPSYTSLQDIVGMALQKEISRMQQSLDEMLSDKQKGLLDELIAKRETFLYELTLLKKYPKDFSFNQVKGVLQKREKLYEYNSSIEAFIKSLNISDYNLQYYSDLVVYYTVQKINQMSALKRRLLLSCFIYIRYRMINDYLVKAFLYWVKKYIKDAKKNLVQEIYETRIPQYKQLKKMAGIGQLFIDPLYQGSNISYEDLQKIAFSIATREELEIFVHEHIKKGFDEKSLEWGQLEKMKTRIRKNLRPLVYALDFQSNPSSRHIVNKTTLLKKELKKGYLPKKIIMPDLFSKSINKYVYSKKGFIDFRYEFQLYKTIAEKLISGDVFIQDSLLYRSLEDDLIDRNNWKNNKEKIVATLGLPKLQASPKVLLGNLKKELNELYTNTNKRIIQGENTYVEWDKGRKKWKMLSLKPEYRTKIGIFENTPFVGLSTLLNLVNSHTRFTDAFTHVLDRYAKKEKKISSLLATITACATNIGLGNMARNANVRFEEMQQTYKNFIRLDSLKKSCSMIANHIKELPVFSQWNIDTERVYSSSDGQKFGVGRMTYNARYSPRYFGLEKGIVSYTLKANYVPLNSCIIGANEHESQFVLDILLGNMSEIKPDVHTTDSHGVNRVNFALLYLFDYVFAPRYKSPLDEAKKIYSLSGIDEYDNYVFPPKEIINTSLVEQEWDNILRVVSSLATKTTSQSTIVRKLSAYRRKNNIGRALEELNKIIKSIHLLRYINEEKFRKDIQKTLNRGELYHSLKRAIFYNNGGKCLVSNEVDQNIWSECTRLIALCIIYYNSFILSKISDRYSKKNQKSDFLKHTSPIQWQHVDMYGKFYFGDAPNESEIQQIIKSIEEINLPFP